MIKLDIELTKEDLQVLSLMDFSEEDYAESGFSYSMAIECQSFDIEENYKDGILDGHTELQDELNTFKTNVENLLTKIRKVEN